MTARFLILLVYCCVLWPLSLTAAELPRFAVAGTPIPVFNTPQAALPQAKRQKDRCGQVRQLEFIALPGTVFEVMDTLSAPPGVLQVHTADYQTPPGIRLYVATELLTRQSTAPPERRPLLPAPSKIIQQLRTAVGLPYIWGGNWRNGVTEAGQLHFAGLDCSGLLYEATDGYTPRNTEQLVAFGSPVAIEGGKYPSTAAATAAS